MPGVNVGLLALSDSAPSVGEPCEEGTGLGDLLLGVVGLGASQRSLLRLGPQAPHLVPRGEVPEKLTVFGLLDDGDPFGQPPLVEDELPVNSWEDAGVHQQVTQVSDSPPGGFLVQPLVGERDAASGQASEETDDVGVAKPNQSALGPAHIQEDLDQRQ
ncbi:hypothetical protein [Streptomyces sp. NPDC056982]|uniref:hypothetical protein n=1 Tax=Streptomyces sp. NPDC056982 TaxID=3345986 RepID=UPI00364197FB